MTEGERMVAVGAAVPLWDVGLPADHWIEQFHEWVATEGFIS